MKKTLRYTLVTLLVVVVAGAVISCGHHRSDPQARADWAVKKVTRKLDLDDVQQSKLRAVTDEFVEQHRAYQDTRTQSMDELLAELRKPAMDQAVLQQMVAEHQARVSEVSPAIIEKIVDFHASLNDEQRQEMADRLQEFRDHRRQEG